MYCRQTFMIISSKTSMPAMICRRNRVDDRWDWWTLTYDSLDHSEILVTEDVGKDSLGSTKSELDMKMITHCYHQILSRVISATSKEPGK
jgi:hypothetical protein